MDLTDLTTRLRTHVERLAATPRPPGSPAHARARQYIRDHLERAGFPVTESSHDSHGFRGVTCVNLLAEPLPPGAAGPLLIVGAHYDSTPDTPGADDNASAVAALLELAAEVGPWLAASGPLPARLLLASYDLEEYGLIGSGHHSRTLARTREPVLGMISLEMLGYIDHRPGSQNLPAMVAHLYPDVGDFIGVCGNEDSLGLVQAVTEAMKTVPGLPVECIAVPGRGEVLPEVRLSDHSSFWEEGFPALMITDTSFFRNPHYHRPSDTPDTLDYPFLAKVTAGVCATVRRLLTTQEIDS